MATTNKTAAEKKLLRKIRAFGEYGQRTGDWEPARKMQSLLEDVKRELKDMMERLKQPAVKKVAQPTKKRTRKEGV